MAVCSLGGYVLSEHLSVELRLSTLATDSSGKLDVLGHDGDTLGVDSAQVGVLKQTNKVSLRSFLQGKEKRIRRATQTLSLLHNLKGFSQSRTTKTTHTHSMGQP